MISIIVPVYNAEAYIENCIKSILRQTFDDIEIILINDGSEDNSVEIIDTLCQKDDRIKVFHKQNGGVSSARNLGLDKACGEYIMFVDSDDCLGADLCSHLIAAMENSDLTIGGFRQLFISEQKIIMGDDKNILMNNEFGECFDYLYKNNFLNAPFSKLYKKQIIADQRFDPEVALGEDFLFNLEYLRKCKQISIVHTDLYFYNCMNENSATRRFREGDIRQIVALYKAGKKFRTLYSQEDNEAGPLEERLCINEINLLQLLFYSDCDNSLKKSLTLELFKTSEFIKACNYDWNFPVKYDIPRKMCARKSIMSLRCFYFIKKIIWQIQYKIRK